MKISKIRFKNKNFKIVDLKDFGFLVEPRYYFYGWSNLKSCYARFSVAKRLLLVRKYLLKGYNFKIWDSFRRKETQKFIRMNFKRRLENLHPNWNSEKILEALNIFTGSPMRKIKKIRLTGHFFGGAVDLTIINEKGDELDMGTDFDDITERATLNYYENKKFLNSRERAIKRNRRLLTKVMKKAGFNSYPPEWWHWSYSR